MIRIDKRRRIIRTMSAAGAGRSLRVAASVVALSAAVALGGQAALADMVVVQQDDTPIASAPGVGGRILARVDAGTTLTVLGREGEWLQVEDPQLPAAGTLWIPAGRVGDIIAGPAEMATAQPATAAAGMPQFQMMAGSTGRMMAPALDPNGAADARNSGGVSASVGRSTATNGARVGGAAVQSGGTAMPTAEASTTTVGNAAPATGAATTVGNATPAASSGTTVDSNPTAALGNPTTAVSANPTPALGNPTPAGTGNATPALGNPTPAMGNPVSGFGRTTTKSP